MPDDKLTLIGAPVTSDTQWSDWQDEIDAEVEAAIAEYQAYLQVGQLIDPDVPF